MTRTELAKNLEVRPHVALVGWVRHWQWSRGALAGLQDLERSMQEARRVKFALKDRNEM